MVRFGPFSAFRRVPILHAGSAIEGGIASLAMVAHWYGFDIDLVSIRGMFPNYRFAQAPTDIKRFAEDLGFVAVLKQGVPENITSLALPCILLWNAKRYVVLEKVYQNTALIADPTFGRRRLGLEHIFRHASGIIIEVAPSATFEPGRRRATLQFANLLSYSGRYVGRISQGLILSLILQLISLAMPLYLRIVVDRVIATKSAALLEVIALGFSLLAVLNALATGARGLVVRSLTSTFSFSINTVLFRRLMRLPVGYFEGRSSGNLLQRTRAVESVKELAGDGITAAIDAILAVVTAVLMCWFSIGLTLIVLSLTATYGASRVLLNSFSTHLFAEAWEADAREMEFTTETFKGIQNIKVFLAHRRRESAWLRLHVEKLRAVFRFENVQVIFDALALLITGAIAILVVYYSTRPIIDHHITLGALIAFMAYATQFTTRVFSLADKFSQYRVLAVQWDRIADIASAATEKALDDQISGVLPRRAAVAVRGLTFRYGPRAKPVLQNLSLSANPGEFVVIRGPSGAGKSTLVKLLLGLYEAEAGSIEIGDIVLSPSTRTLLRKICAAVTAEDQVFTGTISENISFFSKNIDTEHVRYCALLAQLHQDIMMMPGGYDTRIGEQGQALSSGQKQRLFIARALYVRPRVIVMDEGTANLDRDCEVAIVAGLKSLGATCIMIAHSKVIIDAADRIFEIRGNEEKSADLSAGLDQIL